MLPHAISNPGWRPSKKVLRAYLQGGLGNQLFTFIAGWVLTKENDLDLELDFRYVRGGSNPQRQPELLNFLLPSRSGWPRLLIRPHALPPVRARIESGVFRRLPKVLSGVVWAADSESEERLNEQVSGGVGLFALLQCSSFADRAEEFGFNLAMPSIATSQAVQEVISRMWSERPIVLHVRRGDYARHTRTLGMLEFDYYARGVNALRGRGESGKIWLFTDGDEGLARRLQRHLDQEIWDVGATTRIRNGFDQFLVLREAKALVIANSSYSWWAARMAGSDAKVVAPRPWFCSLHRDLVHRNWIPVASELDC